MITQIPPPTSTTVPTSPISFTMDVGTVIISILILLLGILFLVILFRKGWRIKDLKKVKIGELELERNNDQEAKTERDKSAIDKGINVEVRNSTFHRDVGDIGGVIIKGRTSSRVSRIKK